MNGPVGAAVDLIALAKRGDVSADVAVEMSTAGMSDDELRSTLVLLFPFFAELWEAKVAGEKLIAARDRRAFDELARQLGDIGIAGDGGAP